MVIWFIILKVLSCLSLYNMGIHNIRAAPVQTHYCSTSSQLVPYALLEAPSFRGSIGPEIQEINRSMAFYSAPPSRVHPAPKARAPASPRGPHTLLCSAARSNPPTRFAALPPGRCYTRYCVTGRWPSACCCRRCLRSVCGRKAGMRRGGHPRRRRRGCSGICCHVVGECIVV